MSTSVTRLAGHIFGANSLGGIDGLGGMKSTGGWRGTGGAGEILMAYYDQPNSFIPSWRTFGRASQATRFGPTGYPPETIATDLPRFDYAPTTPFAARGLLLEGPRTNLFLNSAALSTQVVTTTAAAHTLSFYGTGTVALSGTYTGSLAGTGASNRVTLTFTPTAGALTCTVTGTVEYAQMELGSFASSWIPTGAGSVARAIDTFTGLVANEHGVSQGSKAIRIRTSAQNSPPFSEIVFSIDIGSTDNRFLLKRIVGDLRMQLIVAGLNSFEVTIATGVTADTIYDIAVRWGTNAIQAQVAGQAASAVQAFTMPAALTTVRYNGTPTAGNPSFIHLQRELSAKTPLPLSELLTRISA